MLRRYQRDDFTVAEFVRRIKTELSCLTGHDEIPRGGREKLDSLLTELSIELEGQGRRREGRDGKEELDTAINACYRQIAVVREARSEDWKRSSTIIGGHNTNRTITITTTITGQ